VGPVSDGIEAGYEKEASSHGGKNIDVEFCGVFVVVIIIVSTKVPILSQRDLKIHIYMMR
jgi:hypothetical protein